MSQVGEFDVLKEIPGYKVILKSVIKSQIQLLIEQLSDQTGEESIILTASVNDGTLTHLGSNMGKGFFEGHDDIKSQFLGYCLKNYHRGLEGGRGRKSSQSESKISTSSYQQGPSISKRQKVQQSNNGSVSSSYSEPFPQYLPTGGSQKSQPQLVATPTSEHSRIASFTANEGTQNVFDTSHVKVEPGSLSQGSSSSVIQNQSTRGLTFHTTTMNTSSFGHESNNHIFNADRQSVDSSLQENNDSHTINHQGTTEETRFKIEHAEESDAELEITAVELATGSSDFQHDTGQTISVGMGYQLLEQGERPENQTTQGVTPDLHEMSDHRSLMKELQVLKLDRNKSREAKETCWETDEISRRNRP